MRGSPWLEEMDRTRGVEVLSDHEVADVAVVGGGISGLTTARALLEGTDHSVVLLESDLVGHGATGHNGGQVVAAFERRYEDLAGTMGQERAAQGFREVRDAAIVLEGLARSVGLPGIEKATAHLGFASEEALSAWGSERQHRAALGLSQGKLRVASGTAPRPPDAEEVPRSVVGDLLWSQDRRYLAALQTEVGLMNSYRFTELLACDLLARHGSRFRLLERSPAELIRLSDEEGVIACRGLTVRADRVVLCTNGYRPPRIEACAPPAVVGRLQGVVGYMVGASSSRGQPGARVYFRGGDESYFYLTRRKHFDRWLTAVGGPEGAIEGTYDPERVYDPDAFERIGSFIDQTLSIGVGAKDHRWQGLMGYTSTGVRAVGPDPRLPALHYNLGCNGIGLLTAVAGAERMAKQIEGRDVEPSMFDPEAALASEKERTVQRAR